MIKFKIIFYLFNIAFICAFLIFTIWLFNKYKFTKGDPFISPPYKKTYYLKKTVQSNFDYNLFFSYIKKNIITNKTIKFYKWILHYDEKENMFWKTELICFYKIGTKKTIMNFEWEKLRYRDKMGIIHLSVDLIYKRNMENILAGHLKIAKNINPQNNSNFEIVNNKKNTLIGYNIKTGDLQYEIKKYENRKKADLF